MDDILLMSWLKNKGIAEGEFHQVMERYFNDSKIKEHSSMKDFSNMEHAMPMGSVHTRRNSLSDEPLLKQFKRMSELEKREFMTLMLSEEVEGHFNESQAKYVVSSMYHSEGGRKYVGEKFDIIKSKEVCDRYRGILPQNTSHYDVYVAINLHYHDLCELYKNWFGDSVDTKIIESAIIYWFKDDDYNGSCKIWERFDD